MRLLFVGTSRSGGGTETHFITLVHAMLQAGHQVAVVVHPGAFIHQMLQGSGAEITTGTFRNAGDPRGIHAVARAIRAFRPDWIIGSFSKEYWPLALLAKSTGVKLALFKHVDKPMRRGTKWLVTRVTDRFILVSAYMRERMLEQGLDGANLHVLYNPLDTQHFRPDPAQRAVTRSQYGIPDDAVVVGYVGMVHALKGVLALADALREAMAEEPRLHALWVGLGEEDSPDQARMKEINAKFSARHHYRTFTRDVRPSLAAMDLLAIPSITPETFGRVSIEAQAAGIPVIGNRFSGIPETMLEGETGLLVPLGDRNAWVEAILALVRDDERRRAMGRRGREHVVERFSAPAIAREFEVLLSS